MLRKIGLAGLLTLCGCTSLQTSTAPHTGDTRLAVQGIPYNLPILQYELKITRTLTQCFEPKSDGTPSDNPKVVFAVAIEAVPHYVSGERYMIDYRSLAGFTKITSFSLESHASSGTLKSINATAEDRSAQIISAGIRTGIGIASLAMGIPRVESFSEQEQEQTQKVQVLGCKPAAGSIPSTQALLDAVREATGKLKAESDLLEGTTRKVQQLTEQARLNQLDESGKKRLQEEIELQRARARAVTAAEATLKRSKDKISSTHHVRWPQRFEIRNASFALSEDAVGQLRLPQLLELATRPASRGEQVDLCEAEQGENNEAAIRRCLGAQLGVDVLLAPVIEIRQGGPITTRPSNLSTQEAAGPWAVDPANSGKGLFVRPPEPGRLLACRRVANATCNQSSSTLLLRTDDAVVPQLGQLIFLPFDNGMFQNNALSLALRTDGSIEKFEYRETSARGEAVANTATDAVSQIQGLVTAIRQGREAEASAEAAAILSQRTEALAALQFEIDRRARETELAALSHTPDVSGLAALQTQTAESNARTALLRALLAERDAEAALARVGS
jgi:hypothetical protein